MAGGVRLGIVGGGAGGFDLDLILDTFAAELAMGRASTDGVT